jgi:hypothetical protein
MGGSLYQDTSYMLPSGVLSLRIRGHSSELITAASHMYGLDFYQVASNSFVRTLTGTHAAPPPDSDSARHWQSLKALQ